MGGECGSVPQWEVRKMGVKSTLCPPGWSHSALPGIFLFFTGPGWDRKEERGCAVEGKERKKPKNHSSN